MSGPCLKDIGLDDHYEGFGSSIASEFVIPVLHRAVSYDRLTSYFSSESLIAVAEGVESLWRNRGHMRLLVGIHDVPADIAQAASEKEWVDALVVIARARVIDACSRLTDELQRNRIGTLAMMMRDGFLEVRVGAPRWRVGRPNLGLLHNKRLIVRDSCGHCVAAVGSWNETGAALTDNYEELTVDTSWELPGRVTKRAESFQRIWDGQRQDVVVRVLDADFAEELLRAIGSPTRGSTKPTRQRAAGDVRVRGILELFRTSPEFAFANVARAALFPHQERALRDAASRTPIRALLADEVGLGKTIEAGSVIAYSRRFRGVRRILLLTPASLLRQWQSELNDHFGIEAHRYDGARGGFISPSEQFIPSTGTNPLDGAPNVVLVSWHLARASWRDRKVFERSTWKPDLLVVDEAHSARRQRQADGSYRSTQVWKLVDELSTNCRNLLLLTATPMQMQIEEYHGLLLLLGVPKWWSDATHMTSLLEHLGGERRRHELATLKVTGDAVASSLPMRGPAATCLSGPHAQAIGLLGTARVVTPAIAPALMQCAGSLDELAGLITPPALLTIRNTRGGLESIGYRFPKRDFQAPALDLNEPGRLYLRHVDVYLNDAHGKVEVELGLIKRSAVGFLRCTYYQRIVSSISSAEKTLARRKEKLEHFVAMGVLGDEDVNPTEGDDASDEEIELGSLDRERLEQAKQLAAIELQYLDEMLKFLRQAVALSDDPKLTRLREIVTAQLDAGDSILVFSRFTDTVDACVKAVSPTLTDQGIGFGSYTGGGGWIEHSGTRTACDKTVLRQALRDGVIRVLFCSDAASEGLNLQTARVIVNVDVPWNPARLEQRIGRIARLGQRADVVDIHNLWYPGTVEERMYQLLINRQDLYSLAVGDFPDVVGKAIRNHLTQGDSGAPDIAAALSAQRGRAELDALKRIWARSGGDSSMGQAFRRHLYNLIIAVTKRDGLLVAESSESSTVKVGASSVDLQLEEGEGESITVHHAACEVLVNAPALGATVLDTLGVLSAGGTALTLVASSGDSYRVLGPAGCAKLLAHASLASGEPDLTEAPTVGSKLDPVEVLAALRNAFPNRIEVSETLVAREGIDLPALAAEELSALSVVSLAEWTQLRVI